jgi:hypothetical protein
VRKSIELLLYWSRPVLTGLAIVSVVLWTLGFASLFSAEDATTYLAAGERLNLGHSLYGPLLPGDRAVLLGPPYWTAPLVSPPLIAVLWRPVANELGLAVWMALDAAAILAACAYVLVRGRPMLLLICSLAIGLQIATGNVAGFLVGGMVLLWTRRDRPWIGAVLATMIAVKLLPVALVGFTARRAQTWPWMLGGLAVCGVVGVIGAGLEAHLQYPSVVTGLVPYPASLGAWTGLNWLNYLVLLIGIVCGYVLPERWAFVAGLTAFVLAAPGLGIWSFLYALALAAPFGGVRKSLPIARGDG